MYNFYHILIDDVTRSCFFWGSDDATRFCFFWFFFYQYYCVGSSESLNVDLAALSNFKKISYMKDGNGLLKKLDVKNLDSRNYCIYLDKGGYFGDTPWQFEVVFAATVSVDGAL